MHPEIYKIKSFGNCFLGIMAKPRAGDWLADEIHGLALLGVNVLVSLLEAVEVEELGLTGEKGLCEAYGMEFVSFPIPDRSVPISFDRTVELARQLYHDLVKQKSVIIHCRAGIGRSALIAGCVFVSGGETPQNAISLISTARNVVVPDTEEQLEWLSNFYEQQCKNEFLRSF